jgi:FAD:protein FMN transferase
MNPLHSQNHLPASISRRNFLRITAIAGGVLIGGSSLKRAITRPMVSFQETRVLMGTIVHLQIISADDDLARKAVEATFSEMERLIRLFDYRCSSAPLAVLNREGKLDDPPKELCALLNRSIDYGALSGGAFDISIKPFFEAYDQDTDPGIVDNTLVDYRKIRVQEDQIHFDQAGMAITLDSIAKGRVIDGGVAELGALGFGNVLVEAGGDLMASGEREIGEPWKIGIAHPRKSGDENIIASFSLTNQAAATSGDYQNSFSSDFLENHILDPKTGRSPQELSSVTVIAATATDADALSTTLMVLGSKQGLALVESFPYVEAMMISKDLETTISSGFPAKGKH